MAKRNIVEVRLNLPVAIDTKLKAMAKAYGVTRQSIILMILGDTITGVETATRALTEEMRNMDHMTGENKEILNALNK